MAHERTLTWPPVLLTVLLLAGAVGALLAPTAMAGGTLTPLRVRIPAGYQGLSGPAFAGSGVAWATPTADGQFDVTVDHSGSLTRQHVGTGSGIDTRLGSVVTDFAASSTQAALAADVVTCAGASACKYMQYSLAASDVFAGPLGQPLAFTDCGGKTLEDDVSGLESLDLSGSVLAYLDGCAHGVVVRDLAAAPETPFKVFPAKHLVRIAGPYLAVDSFDPNRLPRDQPPPRVTVYDWRSGQVAYRVDGGVPFDIQDDGTLVFDTGGTPEALAWASPSQPSAHPFAHVHPSDVRIAAGKVAVRPDTAVQTDDQFAVFDLAGRQLATTPAADAIASFDFAGDRLVYATQPCEVTGIVTWDLGSPPPTFPPGSCPAGRASSAVANLRQRQLRVPIRCPSAPALGCSGSWDVVLYRPRFDSLPSRVGALGPGEATTLRVHLSRSQACAFARRRVRRTTIDPGSTNTKRPDARHHPVRLRVRTVGRARGCR